MSPARCSSSTGGRSHFHDCAAHTATRIVSGASKREMRMAKIAELCRVGIGTRNMEDWQAYATSVLGLEASSDSTDDRLLLRIDDHHHRLAVHPSDTEDVSSVMWQVQDSRSLQELAEGIEKAGMEVTAVSAETASNHRVAEMAWFTDIHT